MQSVSMHCNIMNIQTSNAKCINVIDIHTFNAKSAKPEPIKLAFGARPVCPPPFWLKICISLNFKSFFAEQHWWFKYECCSAKTIFTWAPQSQGKIYFVWLLRKNFIKANLLYNNHQVPIMWVNHFSWYSESVYSFRGFHGWKLSIQIKTTLIIKSRPDGSNMRWAPYKGSWQWQRPSLQRSWYVFFSIKVFAPLLAASPVDTELAGGKSPSKLLHKHWF